MCTVLLPPGGYPIAVKYIISYLVISYLIIYLIISYNIKPNKSLFFVNSLSNVITKTSNGCSQILTSEVISRPSLKFFTLLIISRFLTKWHTSRQSPNKRCEILRGIPSYQCFKSQSSYHSPVAHWLCPATQPWPCAVFDPLSYTTPSLTKF
jgi:hypothetical protein